MEITYTYCENCGKTPSYTDRCPFCKRRPGILVCESCLRPLAPEALCTTPACMAHHERVEATRGFMREVFGEEQSKRGVNLDELVLAAVQEIVRLRALVEPTR